MGRRCVSDVVLKNEGPMVQTCCRNTNVHVVNSDSYMLRPSKLKKKFFFLCCSTREDISINVSMTTLRLIDIDENRVIYFVGIRSESSYGNMSTQKKSSGQNSKLALAVDRFTVLQRANNLIWATI